MRAIRLLGITAMGLSVSLGAFLYLNELTGTVNWLLKVVGPTAPVLLGLGAYLIVILVRVYVEAPQLGDNAVMDRLDHAGDIGEVAGICGLLGTILAMTAASITGRPDLAGFLQSLTSTLIGSSISAVVIFVSSLMRLKLAGSLI